MEAAAEHAIGPAHRYALKLVCGVLPKEDAEDFAQECLIYCWKKYDAAYNVPFLGFVLWLMKRRLPTYRKRVQRRYHCVPVAEAESELQNVEVDDPNVALNEQFEAIKQALPQLSSKHRLIMDLKLLQSLTNRQIQVSTGANPSTIRTDYRRALAHLTAIIRRKRLE